MTEWGLHRDLIVLDYRHAPPGSDEWEAARRFGLGGSEVAAALGLNDWLSPWELFHRKRGALRPPADTEPMYWGRALEPVIADRWAEDHPGAAVVDPQMMARHRDHSWVLASPDRLVDSDGLLEIKTAGWRVADRWEDGKVPDGYAIQAQWAMEVWARDWAEVVVLIGGQDYRAIRFERSPTLAARIIERAQAFWQLVLDGTPPAPIWSDRVADLHPSEDPTEPPVELSDSEGDSVLEARRLSARAAQLRKDIEAHKNIIRAAMGDASEAIWRDELVATWKTNRKGARVFTLKAAA